MGSKLLEWNASPINGQDVFFTEENFKKHTYSLSLAEQFRQKLAELENASGSPDNRSKPECTAHDQVHRQGDQQSSFSSEVETTGVDNSLGGVTFEENNAGKKKNGNKWEEMKGNCLGLKRLSFPHPSRLTKKEHRYYLQLFQKYTSYCPEVLTSIERKEINKLKEMQIRVAQEQEEFMNYLEETSQKYKEDYNFIHPEAKKYIEERLTSALRRIHHYEQYYVSADTIPIPQTITSQGPVLTHLKTLLELGQIPKTILPNMKSHMKIKLPTSYKKISKQFPVDLKKVIDDGKTWNHEPCSQDQNAEELAKKHRCDIVLSSSVLRCLVDNNLPHFGHQWEIPFVVREHKSDGLQGEFVHKVVYLDKPFIQRNQSVRDRNHSFHKFSLKCLLTHPLHPKSHWFGGRRQDTNHQGDKASTNSSRTRLSAELFQVGDEMEDLETFGTGTDNEPDCSAVDGMALGRNVFGGYSKDGKHKEAPFMNVGKGGAFAMASAMEVRENKKEYRELLMDHRLKTGHFNSFGGSVSEKPDLFCHHAAEHKANIRSEKCSRNESSLVSSDCSGELETPLDREASSVKRKYSNFVKGQTLCDVQVAASLGSSELEEGEIEELDDDSLNAKMMCKRFKGSSNDETQMSMQGYLAGRMKDVAFASEVEENLSAADKRYSEVVYRSPQHWVRGNAFVSSSQVKEVSCVESSIVKSGSQVTESLSVQQGPSLLEDVQRRSTCGFDGDYESASSTDSGMLVIASDLESDMSFKGAESIHLMKESGKSDDKADVSTAISGSRVAAAGLDFGTDEAGDSLNVNFNWLHNHPEDAASSMVSGKHFVGRGSLDDDDHGLPTGCQHGEDESLVKTEGNSEPQQSDQLEISSGDELDRRKQEPLNGAHGRTTRQEETLSNSLSVDVQLHNQESWASSDNQLDQRTVDCSLLSVVMAGSDFQRKSLDVHVGQQVSRERGMHSRQVCRGSEPQVHATDSGGELDSGCGSGAVPPDLTLGQQEKSQKSAGRVSSRSTPEALELGEEGRLECIKQTGGGGARKQVEQAELKERESKDQPETVEQEEPRRKFTRRGRGRRTISATASVASSRMDDSMKSDGPVSQQLGVIPSPLDSILQMQTLMLQPPSTQINMPHPPTSIPSSKPAAEEVADCTYKNFDLTTKEEEEDTAKYLHPSKHNITYNLWSIGNLRVLIRCSYHGKITSARNQGEIVYMVPKLEYQPSFGVEQVTASEASQMWISSYVRQGCRVVRARVNAFTSEIMMLDKLDPPQLLQPHLFSPTAAFTFLSSAFQKCHGLPAGQYLLGHQAGDVHCHVKRSTKNTRGTYDLYFNYMGIMSFDTPEKHLWIPVDPHIITPFHKKIEQIPATFNPRDFRWLGSTNSGSVAQGSKKKKKKRKKKKTDVKLKSSY